MKGMSPMMLGQPQMRWTSAGTIDATASEADAALAVTERNFQSVKALDNAVWFKIPQSINSVELRFLMTTNDATADIDVYTGEIGKDPSHDSTLDCDLQRRCTLDVICGQQDVYGTAKHFAQDVNVSNDASYTAIGESDPGDDHMKKIAINVRGADVLILHGYGTFDEDVEVEWRGWS